MEKKDILALIEKEIKEHKENLNSKDFDMYKTLYWDDTDEKQTNFDVVDDCDIDSEDFNIWHEQGYINWMNCILNLIK